MDLEFTWAWFALWLALFPAAMTVANLVFVRPADGRPEDGALVSILIPARNEEAHVATCLRHALDAAKKYIFHAARHQVFRQVAFNNLVEAPRVGGKMRG